jgi:protein TonB
VSLGGRYRIPRAARSPRRSAVPWRFVPVSLALHAAAVALAARRPLPAPALAAGRVEGELLYLVLAPRSLDSGNGGPPEAPAAAGERVDPQLSVEPPAGGLSTLAATAPGELGPPAPVEADPRDSAGELGSPPPAAPPAAPKPEAWLSVEAPALAAEPPDGRELAGLATSGGRPGSGAPATGIDAPGPLASATGDAAGGALVRAAPAGASALAAPGDGGLSGGEALDRAAEIVAGKPPAYPALSRRLGEEGTVLCRLSIAADGSVSAVEVLESSGFPRLDRAAEEGLREWTFRPAIAGGRPVARRIVHRVVFRLTPPPASRSAASVPVSG